MFSLLRFAWLGVRASGEIVVTTLLMLIVNFYRICDSIPFLDVVFCLNTNFINCCLNSSSEILHYVTRHGFFHECALQLVAMHYVVVSGMERGQTIYQLLILV